MKSRACLLALLLSITLPAAHAEDGYELWLRYHPLQTEWITTYRHDLTELVAPARESKTLQRVSSELSRGLGGLLAHPQLDRL